MQNLTDAVMVEYSSESVLPTQSREWFHVPCGTPLKIDMVNARSSFAD